jgi:pimeloyl-ACP methyl ester carboxylesterase
MVVAACSSSDAGPTTVPTTAATTTAGTTTVAPTTTATSAPTTTTTTVPPEPTIQWGDCPFNSPTRDAECGTLAVPANRRDPDSETIRLQVAVFRTESRTPLPDPIVYLSGGPGWPAIMNMLIGFDVVFGDFIGDRDVVLFDQRGTGLSEPDTTCPEVADAKAIALEEGLAAVLGLVGIVDAFEACRDRLLEAGVDLTGFDTTASAADVDDLRRALGYEQWNLYGISYGTRLAIEVLRDHPEGVRSAILDSVLPPQVDLIGTQVANLGAAIDEVFGACASSPECTDRYGDVETRFWDLARSLETSPIEITTRYQAFPYDITVDGAMFIVMAFFAMYVPQLVAIIPAMIDRVAEGDGRALNPFGANLIAFVGNTSVGVGMSESVTCRDEVPFAVIETPDDPLLIEVFETGRDFEMTDLCELWGAGVSPPVANEAVATAVPVLALAGQFDPITPPAWTGVAVDDLDPAFAFEFPGLGHGVSVNPCPRSILLDFVDDPTTPPDRSCVTEMPPIEFMIRP